ncbi:NUDIX domain-containing protein [Agrobacterium sp. ES01]|uniref:NUDIX domain-containing protein n=1 Tax=Agrobacterium sp. ES01 TaxID=3420714 RepID=UPI003D0FD054
MSKFDRTTIDVVSDETLWDGWSRLRRVTFDYTGDDGKTDRLDWEVFDRGEAVALFLFNSQRQTVVLVRQFRVPAFLRGDHAFLLEVPAGALEKDEDPAQAICREALEETGYKVEAPTKLFSLYMSPGAVTEKVHFYSASVDDSAKVAAGGGLEDEHEDLELCELPLDEALAMIESGTIVDGKTVVFLQWAALNRDRLFN